MIHYTLRNIRVSAGLSQEQMASRCKVALRDYIQIEDGSRYPYSHEENRINDVLNQIIMEQARARDKLAKWNASVQPASQDDGEGGVR